MGHLNRYRGKTDVYWAPNSFPDIKSSEALRPKKKKSSFALSLWKSGGCSAAERAAGEKAWKQANHLCSLRASRSGLMAGKAVQSVAKAVGEYQYPWREKLSKYKNELTKGVWGYWELGAWKPLGISARRRARLRKEVLLAGQDWPYDPEMKEMRNVRKGHKCDRISAEKRENTARLMEKMPDMLLAYKKRRWEKKMKEEDKK